MTLAMGCCFGDDGIDFGDPYIPDDRSPKNTAESKGIDILIFY